MWGPVMKGSAAIILLGSCRVAAEQAMNPQSMARVEIPAR